MSLLFSPLDRAGLVLPNRIAVAPMCQYSADDGSATDWHVQHWMNLAMSGAGMITVEATAVERRGRITHGCLGLYSDHNEAAARRALDAARRVAPAASKFGVQLAHAGRKASLHTPWEGSRPLEPGHDAWPTVAASAIPFAPDWPVPAALSEEEIAHLVHAFARSAKRAQRAGFDFIEIHAAHGYLLNTFLSPLSNQRTDRYGGSLENRMRVFREVFLAIRDAVPHMPVGARISATEWAEGGFDIDEAVAFSAAASELGVGYICASSGGNAVGQKVPNGQGYQLPLAARIRRESGIVTRAVGRIDTPEFAEQALADGAADLIALARPFLADPRWPWRAAVKLGAKFRPVRQYERAWPTLEAMTGS